MLASEHLGRQSAYLLLIRAATVSKAFSVRFGRRSYGSLAALAKFELILIWATERDLLGVRTNARGNDVYLYPCDVIPEKQTALLEAMMPQMQQQEVARPS